MKNWAAWPIWVKIGGVLGALAALAAILTFLGYPTLSSIFGGEATKVETASGSELPAPKVTFASGETCIVKFAVEFQLPPENVLSVAHQFGSNDNADIDLKAAVVSSLMTVLEAKALSEVRSDRASAEKEIAEVASGKVFSPGYVIHGVDLHDILC